MKKIAWIGHSDTNYWNYIAKFCVPSWKLLPGKKILITDFLDMHLSEFTIIDCEKVYNKISKFPNEISKGKKQTNFWKKMQSQVWAIKNLQDYDFLILLDTDIEVINFNSDSFFKKIDIIESKNCLWGIGRSQDKLLDSGFIIINNKHCDKNNMVREYEQYWETEKIHLLKKPYDGDVVQELTNQYPYFGLENYGWGDGRHFYDCGLFHWGSKEPKKIRSTITDSNFYLNNLLENLK
jgi:hypothetical protein